MALGISPFLLLSWLFVERGLLGMFSPRGERGAVGFHCSLHPPLVQRRLVSWSLADLSPLRPLTESRRPGQGHTNKQTATNRGAKWAFPLCRPASASMEIYFFFPKVWVPSTHTHTLWYLLEVPTFLHMELITSSATLSLSLSLHYNKPLICAQLGQKSSWTHTLTYAHINTETQWSSHLFTLTQNTCVCFRECVCVCVCVCVSLFNTLTDTI